ncbi:MAG: hypothetical protein R3248_10530 [Candidatus Promineifilaceae bacterium]|nr:hypothetical protein [Candidatus Promineifilaceae bacterium]
MSNGDAQQTTIQVAQQFGTVRQGGQGVGVLFEQHTGDIYFSSPDARPPRLETVAAYLEGAKVFPPPPRPVLERFAGLPFQARRPGENQQNGRDLDELVQELFAHDRELGRIQRVVVLAEAGTGKTPALFYLRTEAATRSLADGEAYLEEHLGEQEGEGQDGADALPPDSLVLPIFIDLARLNGGLSLYALVRDAFNAYMDPAAGLEKLCLEQVPVFLDRYPCLFLMDGLDEVISARHQAGLHLVYQFMEQHPDAQYVITSRTASYREQLGALDTIYLNDLREEDAIAVIGREKYEHLSNSLQQLARNRGMLELILTMEDEAVQLQNKGQLLRRLNQRRLGDAGVKAALSAEVAQGLLEHLAAAMHQDHVLFLEEEGLMELVSRYLEQWNESQQWRPAVNALRDDYELLERDGQRRWKFASRTTQAYYAAEAILSDPSRLNVVLSELSDYWWREMLEILVGLVPEPTVLFFELVDRDALVAANSVQYAGRELDGRVVDAVIDALVERMGQESSTRRKFIVERIGESAHPRAPEALFLALHREDASMVVKAIARALWSRVRRGGEGEKGVQGRLDELEKVEKDVLHTAPRTSRPVIDAIRAYAESRAEGEEMAAGKESLMALMTDPEESRLCRGLAAVYVGQFAAENVCDEEARQALLDLFVDPEADDFIAWCATEALTACVHEEVEEKAISLFKDEAYRQPQWRRHRARAVYLLGWVSGKAKTGSLVQQGLQDDNMFVRGYAVESMARLDLPNARTLIEERLDPDSDNPETNPEVMRKMAEALAQIGTMASIPILQRHLRHERTRTRHMMRRAIAEIRQRYSL